MSTVHVTLLNVLKHQSVNPIVIPSPLDNCNKPSSDLVLIEQLQYQSISQ